jgi:multiple sugar transport system permease protein
VNLLNERVAMSRSRANRKSLITGVIMFAPYLILLVAFGLIPIVVAGVTSLESSVINPGGGPLNYAQTVQDFRFLPALADIGIFLLMYVPAMLIVVALMSLLLDTVQGRWNLPLRLFYIVPASLTGATSVLIWYFLLQPTLSPYKGVLQAIGITQGGQIWRDSNLAWIFALMAFFTGAGNWIVVQYGSLQSISDDILEAARIDGANAWQIGWHIKLPLIQKYLVYMGILVFAAALQVFVEPQLISSSVYPGLATNWSLNQLAYSFAFQNNNFGEASALSLMLLVVCIIGAVFVIFRTDFFDGAGVKEK